MREPQTRDVRVLVVDDMAPFRVAARALIDAAEGFVLAAAVGSGASAVEVLAVTHVDLALVDLDMPGLDGFETAAALRARDPELVVVVVSAQPPARWKGAVPPMAVVPKEELSIGWLDNVWRSRDGAL